MDKFKYFQKQWSEEGIIKNLEEEMRILNSLRGCPEVIDPPTEIVNTEYYCFLMHKYYNSGNFYNYLSRKASSGEYTSEEVISHVLSGVLKALQETHRINVIHSDLKP